MKTKLNYAYITILVVLCGCQERIPEEIRKFTPEAEFIFIGTVQLKNSSTFLAGEVADLAVVLVDKVLHAPPIYEDFEKEQITIKLKDIKTTREGERRLFFVNSWLFGESVAVKEVGSYVPAKFEEEKLKSQVTKMIQDTFQKQLQERLGKASIVVLGKVKSVEKDPKSPPLVTEHDPEWWNAVIEVEKTLKGDVKGTSIIISFANSTDVVWQDSPKFKIGDEGIWILHTEFPKGLSASNPAALSPEDFRSPKDLALCQKLIKK